MSELLSAEETEDDIAEAVAIEEPSSDDQILLVRGGKRKRSKKPKDKMRMSLKVSLLFGLFCFVLCAIVMIIMTAVQNTISTNQARALLEQSAVLVADVQDRDSLTQYFERQGLTGCVRNGDTIVWSYGEIPAETTAEFERDGNKLIASREYNGLVITVAYDVSGQIETKALFLGVLVTSLMLMILMLMVISAAMIELLMRPVKQMTETTRLVTKDALDTRLNMRDAQDEFRELAEVINNMLDNLQVAMESQERFVSDASHELRTPISIIKGYAAMLRRWGSSDKAILSESIEAIEKEVVEMQALLNDLLFLSRADRELQKEQISEFSVGELTEEVFKEAEMVDQDHIFLMTDTTSESVCSVRSMVKQVLRIVVDNARKYTPKGGSIQIGCERDGDNILFLVTDQGIGITKKDLDHVFDRFYRADKARNRSGGTGLGLSIAKKIADLLGGEIILKSQVGCGTQVMFYVPKEWEEEE